MKLDLAAYDRDGFLVLKDFLSAADCDALQARAGELVAAFDPGPARTVFSTRDQGHARDRYFQESGGAIRFFFEEEATDQPVPLALNKIGHALHDLDPVFDHISRQSRLAELAGYVAGMDARQVGIAVVALGGGRAHADDAIDPSVGLTDVIDVGAPIRAGSPLCVVHAASDADADQAIEILQRAIRIEDSAPAERPTIIDRIGR